MIDMALLSVIRRWHFREGMPIREIGRRTGLSRNTIRKYLRSGAVEPKFKIPVKPSKLDAYAEKLSGWLRVEVGKSRKQTEHRPMLGAWGDAQARRSRFTLTSWCLAMRGAMVASRRLCVAGRPSDNAMSRRVAEALSCRWCLRLVRLSSSTGAKTGPCLAASAPSYS